jgi:DNA-binding MarR family transcriptional regulator
MPSIEREIKQSKPFPSRGQQAFVGLLRTADLVERVIDGVIARAGITGQQYNVLRILRGAGESGLLTLDIAERMIERTPGITGLIDRLETKKLVKRRRSSDDRRCVYCQITPAGLALLARLDRPVNAAAESAFQSVKKRELAQMVRILDRLREHLHANERTEES